MSPSTATVRHDERGRRHRKAEPRNAPAANRGDVTWKYKGSAKGQSMGLVLGMVNAGWSVAQVLDVFGRPQDFAGVQEIYGHGPDWQSVRLTTRIERQF